MVNQSFYFLKDAFHSHKHHNDTEDTLVSVTECNGTDQAWADNTTKSIYRYILRQRKLFDKNSIGIFCYLRTFKLIIDKLVKDGLINKEQLITTRTIALEELEKSITCEIEQRENDVTFKRWFVGISLLIFQMSVFYLYKVDDDFSCWLKENTEIIWTVAISLIFGVFKYTENLEPKQWLFTTQVQNLLISIFKNRSGLLKMLFLFLSSLLFIVYYFS